MELIVGGVLVYSIETWSVIGDWLSAVATVGAVVVALWSTKWAARSEAARQHQELELQALATASMVTVEARFEDPDDWHPGVADMPDVRVRGC